MRGIVMLVGALASLVVVAPAATAAPPERETFELVCDHGRTYEVEVNGNGAFTPARVVGSTRVIIPTSFGDFFFRAVPPGGEPIEGSFPGGEAKGGGAVQAKSPRTTTDCTFSATFVLEEPDAEFGLPAGTVVTFSGEVTGFVTPARG